MSTANAVPAPGSGGISCVVSCYMSLLFHTQTRPLRAGGELVILRVSRKITSDGGLTPWWVPALIGVTISPYTKDMYRF